MSRKINNSFIVFSSILSIFLFNNSSTAKEELVDNFGLAFSPVREEFVNELPESIKDFPTSSMMPIVFRGAAKNWGAMKWTPESLAEVGLPGPSKVFGTNDRSVDILDVTYKQEERIVSNKKFADLLEQDTHFREDYNYSPKFYPEGVKNPRFKYILFAGGPGASQVMFDYHEAVLLTELYGEKMVFLMAPGTFNEDFKYSRQITTTLKKYMQDGLTMKDAITRMIDNETWDPLIPDDKYNPLQRVILKPGDILYIPAGWAHRVFYLNDSIGITQAIEQDTVNWQK